MDRHDFTNKYNTPIPAELQKQYENYLGKLEAPLRSSYDYDIQGAFLDGAKAGANNHFPDKFKKPNHPTFSDQSIYHNVGGNAGGFWLNIGGKDVFVPSKTNRQHYPPNALQDYFDAVEWASLINDITE